MAKDPRKIINDTLLKAGYPQQTVNFWICVSAFESANWTSAIFKKYNNLWGMGYSKNDSTAIGVTDTPERQAAYSSVQSSADDLILFMEKRWKYPKSFSNLAEMIHYMKQRNYFTVSESQYLAGVTSYYNKMFL
jgi:uncharacterized FlgJ-related protein